jgi:hypothetical protein
MTEEDQQSETDNEDSNNARKRISRNFPSMPFEECEAFARAIYAFGSGNPVRRLSIFSHLQKSPDSSASRALISNSYRYGLTKGNYKSEHLELTTEGRACVAEEVSPRARAKARFHAAIELVGPFNSLYQQNINLKRPANSALADAILAFDVAKEAAEEAVETFIVNLKLVGLLVNVAGAERIVSIDHVLDGLPTSAAGAVDVVRELPLSVSSNVSTDLSKTCFYITPIGNENSEQRRHSDLFLSNIVEPALLPLGLTVVRADKIQKAGSITKHVLELLLGSRLVVADLSYHNPNVFYELAVRHVTRKPVVQIVRKGDGVPFDINQLRTIEIDNSSIYELVPRLETYRAEIASQARAALEDAALVDNPMATFFPSLSLVGMAE